MILLLAEIFWLRSRSAFLKILLLCSNYAKNYASTNAQHGPQLNYSLNSITKMGQIAIYSK